MVISEEKQYEAKLFQTLARSAHVRSVIYWDIAQLFPEDDSKFRAIKAQRDAAAYSLRARQRMGIE